MEKTTLGQALVERRIELGIDKARAAATIGVTRATYSAYESDSRRFSLDGLPALRAFLDVAVEDFLELYAATCVAQARVVLLRDLFISDSSMIERPIPTTMLVKNVRDNEMSVVERVFFDVVTAKGHGVTSPYTTQPSASSSAVRAPTSSVLGRFEDHANVPLSDEKAKGPGGKKKRKKRGDRADKKKRMDVKEKEKRQKKKGNGKGKSVKKGSKSVKKEKLKSKGKRK